MRLLNTHALEIREFDHRGEDTPPYAILSHVWDNHEQTYQDITAIIATNKGNAGAQSSWQGVSTKLVQFCKLAASLGYDWGWSDTCCINKESSAELSEAINSMFDWYSKSDVCIAYLADVQHPADTAVRGSTPFSYSRWFSRGWTLQELIAPTAVIFVTKDWQSIGTKVTLANLISSATDISTEVLTTPGAFSGTSVMRRLMWARERQTTRVEDRAYSLMGLFGVNMSTIYGEGDNAFKRLQEEILKTSSDQTLFAWGTPLSDSFGHDMETGRWPPGFFAPSMRPFADWGSYYGSPEPLPLERYPDAVDAFVSKVQLARKVNSSGPGFKPAPPRIRYDVPTFTLTSHGVHAKLPLIRLKKEKANSNTPVVAVLACTDGDCYIGIFLHRCSTVNALPLYAVGVPPALQTRLEEDVGMVVCSRLVYADPSAQSAPQWPTEIGLGDGAEELMAEWAEIYISQTVGGFPTRPPPAAAPRVRPVDESLPVIPTWVVGKLRRAGFSASAPTPPGAIPTGAIETTAHTSPEEGEGECTVAIKWTRAPRGGRPVGFVVRLAAMRTRSMEYGVDWDFTDAHAGVQFDGDRTLAVSRVAGWEGGARTFGDGRQRAVRLTFSPGQAAGTTVLDIDVGGSAYGLPPLVMPPA